MVALANPKAIFTNYNHHKQCHASSPFSLIYDKLFSDYEYERCDEAVKFTFESIAHFF